MNIEGNATAPQQHKLSICIEGAIFYEDCCGIGVTINKWLDYLDSLTADIRGVGRDWWTRGEMRGERELHLRCVIIVNWLLRRSFQFCFGCKLKKWDDAAMWWCNRGVWIWDSELHIFLNQTWPHWGVILFHTMSSFNIFLRENITFYQSFCFVPGS